MKSSAYSSRQWFWFSVVTLISGARIATPFLLIFGYYPAVQHGQVGMSSLYLIVIALLTAGDAIDGRLARRYEVDTPFGSVLDHVTDTITLVTALIVWVMLLHQANFGYADNPTSWIFLLVVLTVLSQLVVALLNRHPTGWDDGANNLGRTKYAIQGIGLAIGGIGVTWFYHDPWALLVFTGIAGTFLFVGLIFAGMSIFDYHARNKIHATT
jgi:phosphatidylglycerophosphate synthase